MATLERLSRDEILEALGYPETRLGRIVALAMYHEQEIMRHTVGALEFNFAYDQVKVNLKVSLPLPK